jgi:hypothetical protein
MSTIAEARAEMVAQFLAPWTLAYPTYPAFAEDFHEGERPQIVVPHARIKINHEIGDNDTIVGHIGNALFFRSGFVSVRLYSPTGDGLFLLDNMAQTVLNSYEGKRTPGGIWFRRTRYLELGTFNGWFNGQVITEFNYTQAK